MPLLPAENASHPHLARRTFTFDCLVRTRASVLVRAINRQPNADLDVTPNVRYWG